MSTTTIKAVFPGEKTEDIQELRNSHGSAPIVWNELSKKYLGFRDFEYSHRCEELWPIYKKPEMKPNHRAVLLMTYDNAIVMQKDFKRAAADIRAFLSDFPPKDGNVNHWPSIAEIFDNADCPAIGFHWTSVSEDPFSEEWNEESECYDELDWSVFWDVYALVKQVQKALAKYIERQNTESSSLEAIQAVVARMRRDLEKVGGFENSLISVPAGGVRDYIEELEKALQR